MARTAAIAGTASAVSGRVQRHQAEKFADRDQQIMASRAEGWEQGAQQGYAQPAPPPPQAAPAGGGDDLSSQLQQLASLHTSGVLSDDEFAAAKAKLLSA
jgi:hypothetical protein